MKLLTLPGLIDPHVHLRDPGQTDKEDFLTGTTAALAGGFTTIFDMPNNKVPITTLERLEEKIAGAKQKTVCDLGFYFGSQGDNLAEFAKVEGKVWGIKLYLNETTGNFLIDRDKIENIFNAWIDLPILVHAEDDAVRFIIDLVTKTKKRVHFCHISTSGDLKSIMEAKEKGLPVTCGVTPHHLFLNTADWERLGPYGRMKPPLRSDDEIKFLWQHLSHIDCVESDHAPHTKAEKDGEPAPYGVPGLETTLPLLLTAVSQDQLTIANVIRLCHDGPAQILGLKTHPETKVEVDQSATYTISNESMLTKCGWTPFAGKKVMGKVLRVFIEGKLVFDNGKVLVPPGSGRVLAR